MKLTMKKFLMFAVTFLFVMGISINVFERQMKVQKICFIQEIILMKL